MFGFYPHFPINSWDSWSRLQDRQKWTGFFLEKFGLERSWHLSFTLCESNAHGFSAS